VNGGLHVRKAWKMYEAALQHFKEVARLRSTLKDEVRAAEDLAADSFLEGSLRWGVGSFYFGVSQTPPAFKWLVSALGFVGDREDGLRELELSMNLPSPRAPLAALFVGLIYSFYDDDHEKLKTILDDLQQQHPYVCVVVCCWCAVLEYNVVVCCLCVCVCVFCFCVHALLL
jgi:Iml2/Tetratricopeptide repeat protein 39